MALHIHGKGGKDRYVPLPERTLELLREFWKTHRSKPWLFPATARGLKAGAGIHPLTDSSLQKAFKRALQRTGISKRAHIHSLRHYSEFRTMPSSTGAIALKPGIAGPRRRCAGKILGIVRSDLQVGEKGQK